MADYSELMKLEKKPVAPKVLTEPTPTKDVVYKPTNQQVTTSVDQQISRSTINILIYQQSNKSTNQQVNIPVKP